MSYPTIYDVTYSYTGFQAALGDGSFPGTQLDADMAGLSDSIASIEAFIQQTFRSDGVLKAASLPGTDPILQYVDEAVAEATEIATTAATSASASATAAAGSATNAATSKTQAASSASAAQTARTGAETAQLAAAASAVAAALWDPASYYAKTDFKTDGTADAPVKYTTAGYLGAKSLLLDTVAVTDRHIGWLTDGKLRWRFSCDGTAEAGANAGSNFDFKAYKDDGSTLGTVLFAVRSSQIVTFVKSPLAPTPAPGDDSTKLATTEFVKAALAAQPSGGVPTGAVMGFDLDEPPAGWIVGNGAAVLRSDYPDLDATQYVGDAANATATAWYRCTNPASPSTSRSTTGAYLVTRDWRGVFPRFLDLGRGYDSGRVRGSYQADGIGSHAHSIPLDGGTGTFVIISTKTGTSTKTINTDAAGGSETRPKNVALLGCIKT